MNGEDRKEEGEEFSSSLIRSPVARRLGHDGELDVTIVYHHHQPDRHLFTSVPFRLRFFRRTNPFFSARGPRRLVACEVYSSSQKLNLYHTIRFEDVHNSNFPEYRMFAGRSCG